MAFDSGFCNAVVNELQKKVVGAKAEKVYMPEKDSVVISLYISGRNKKDTNLILSCSPSSPRISVGTDERENPSTPTGFCMLLRKHIASSKIVSAEQYGFDRVIKIGFEKPDEMGYSRRKYIVVEIMGKYSNLFLLGEDDRIMGVLKSADLTNGKRLTLIGAEYELPPAQDKLNTLEVTEKQFLELYDNTEKTSDSFLLSSFLGLSPLVCREISFRAFGVTDAQKKEGGGETLWREFEKIVNTIKTGGFSPCIVYENSGKPVEYSFLEITQYGDKPRKIFESFDELQNEYYSKKGSIETASRKKTDIAHLISSAMSHEQKKLASQLEDLEECKNKEKYKKYGDLIIGSLYMLKYGMEKATLFDYEENVEVTVPLNKRLSPSANAQVYYKKYQKYRNAERITEERVKITRSDIAYLETVEDALSRAITERELEDIRDELAMNGYISQNGSKKYVQKTKKSEPLTFKTSGGFTVKVGKNNIQNDQLTFGADKDDLWFHVKNAPGSHVILYTEGREVGDDDYNEAIKIAALHSSQSRSPLVAVDYTFKRYIKKPSGAKAGFVTYDKYWSAYVKLENEDEKI